MQQSLKVLDLFSWEEEISESIQKHAIESLENGKVLFLPSLSFSLSLEEKQFLTPEIVSPKAKNISYDIHKDALGGTLCEGQQAVQLKQMLKRYAILSRKFVERLFPHYVPYLIEAKTSFRPVEIFGRKSSYRKDDTLLHVDSFPSNPTKGQRILRIFTNINQEGKPRVWRVGEPFEDVVKKMAPHVSKPLPGIASVLKFLKITKDYRTLYDHYMLKMHDRMKGDTHYQQNVHQEEISFPAGSSWIVFTDQVSHAAMSGKDVLEQTFHLPVNGIKQYSTAPLNVLEKFLHRRLVIR